MRLLRLSALIVIGDGQISEDSRDAVVLFRKVLPQSNRLGELQFVVQYKISTTI